MAGLFVLGGSSYYTLQFFEALCASGLGARFDRITLFGRNRARLDLIAEAGAEMLGGGVAVDATTAIEDCLNPQYDILFNQMRFGGLHARDMDERIATDVGLAADETLGIVGISNALRTVTGMAPYRAVIAQKADPFTFVNFTNPCSILCQSLLGAIAAPVIGVCDYPAFMRCVIADQFGEAPAAVELDYFGLNHFGIIYGVRIDGRDMFDAAMAAPLSFKPASNRYFDHLLNVSWSFVFEADRIVARQRTQTNRASALLQFEAQGDALLERGVRDADAFLGILAQRQCDWYQLAVEPALAHLLGERRPETYLNCATGDVFGLGLDRTIIETSCSVTGGAVVAAPLPDSVRASPEFAMIATMKQAETMLLDAIAARDGGGVIASCLVNPMIRDADRCIAYFDRLRALDPIIAAFWS